MKFLRYFYDTSLGKRVLCWFVHTLVGRFLAVRYIANLDVDHRRFVIEIIQRVACTSKKKLKFSNAARRYHCLKPDCVVRLDIFAAALVYTDDKKAAHNLLYSANITKIIKQEAKNNFIPLRIALGHETENYQGVIKSAQQGLAHMPAALRPRLDYLKCAYAYGKFRDYHTALEFFGRQYEIISDRCFSASAMHLNDVLDKIFSKTHKLLKNQRVYENWAHSNTDMLEKKDVSSLKNLTDTNSKPKIAVFFLSSTEALGHAILDPYHHIALRRDKYDLFVFIGPKRSDYRQASQICINFVEQYGSYLETDSDLLLNLSWMSLGTYTQGNVTLFIENYWELLRQVTYNTTDEENAFVHNDWHFEVPERYESFGQSFCDQHGISNHKPLIVLHARHSGYHGLVRQSFRDTLIEDYTDAINLLLEQDYQVIRIGDHKMPRLEIDRKGYFELPFMEGYSHHLDPWFISKSYFMIGCQSGPCAYARVFGVPILSINAVLHYTLLPAPLEMACFKRYYRQEDKHKTELTLIEALKAGVDQFDNIYHFERAGIGVGNANSEEIRASVSDMLAWMKNPETSLTSHQIEFQHQVERYAQALQDDKTLSSLGISDYMGIQLKGYRIAPTVSQMRENMSLPKNAHKTIHPKKSVAGDEVHNETKSNEKQSNQKGSVAA